MFTGLIEKICTIKSVQKLTDTLRLEIDLQGLADDVKIGDSISVDGLCLTVVKISGTAARFDVSEESIRRSTLGGLKTGDKVNIEKAMKASDRFGGHFVQGHVDGIAKITNIVEKKDFADISFSAGIKLLFQMVEKGSVAIDGISLTISELKEDSFSVAIIPETWKNTTLSAKKIGDEVNIETDIIVKTVQRQLENMNMDQKNYKGLTMEKLRESGY